MLMHTPRSMLSVVILAWFLSNRPAFAAYLNCQLCHEMTFFVLISIDESNEQNSKRSERHSLSLRKIKVDKLWVKIENQLQSYSIRNIRSPKYCV